MLVPLVAFQAGCGSGSGRGGPGPGTNPSPIPEIRVVQGSTDLTMFQVAVLSFSITAAGTLSTRIDWTNPAIDIDSVLLRGRCSVEQILAETAPCNEAAVVVADDGSGKPSTLSSSLQPGEYTLAFLSFGPASDSVSYRIEGYVSGESALTRSPAPRTDTFSFRLPARSTGSVLLGPVQVANGPMVVTLDFPSQHVILACVGTATSCVTFGGPASAVFEIPKDFPSGPIQATVYFSPNAIQPPGDATGTVSFLYIPR